MAELEKKGYFIMEDGTKSTDHKLKMKRAKTADKAKDDSRMEETKRDKSAKRKSAVKSFKSKTPEKTPKSARSDKSPVQVPAKSPAMKVQFMTKATKEPTKQPTEEGKNEPLKISDVPIQASQVQKTDTQLLFDSEDEQPKKKATSQSRKPRKPK